MQSTYTDRERAEQAEREAIRQREFERRQTLPIEERIAIWRDEGNGEEIEGAIELLCDAEEEIRRLRLALAAAIGEKDDAA